MTDVDIHSLIKELKRYKLLKWKDDTFEDLSVPWNEKQEDVFQTNLGLRLEQLKTAGKQPSNHLATILNKIKMPTPKQTGRGAKQAKTQQQTTAKGTQRGLAPGTTSKPPEELKVEGTPKEATERPVQHRPGAENRKDENRLMEDIRQHLQNINELIGKPNTKGSNESGKGAKVDMASQDSIADLTNVSSWIIEKKLLMEKTDKEIRKMAKLIANTDTTATTSPTKRKEEKNEKDDTDSPKDLDADLAAVNVWIEKQKTRWHEAEQELQQMKQFIEANTPQPQKLEKNKSSKNQTKDNKTSPDEFVTKLSSVRTWFTEILEQSKLSMEQIGNQIIELKQSLEEPDVDVSIPRKKKNVPSKKDASPDELLSCLTQVHSWIAKHGSQLVKQKSKDQSCTKLEKDDEKWSAVTNWIEHIQQTITTPRQHPFVFHKTSVPCAKLMQETESNLKSKIQNLEESEKTLQFENKKLMDDVKAHKEQLEARKSKSEETILQSQKQSEEFSSALERIQAVCKEGIQTQPSERKKASTNDSQAVNYRNLHTLVNDTIAVVTTKLKELDESNKALESNIKKTEQLKEQVDRFKTKLDEANTETDKYSKALTFVCSMCHDHLQAENTTIYGKEKKKNQPGHGNKGQITEQTVQFVTEIMERQVKIREENDNLRREIGEMQKKYEADRSRLSKYMGADLRAGNPNIADLSDSNRPTKIAEAFSELYDNNWTNAFEELNKRKKVTETNTIENLLDILQFAFEYCTEAATKQLAKLEYYMRSPAIAVSEKAKKDSKKEKESVDPVTLQALHDFRKKTWTVASANLIKHYVNVMKSKEKWKDGYSSKECSLYISTCIQLCWQMVIQDPPVLIQFEKKGKKIKFDKEKYRAYMQSGEQVDFIVWPPIYLHQGGPLLNKGVAEGHK